MVLLGQGVQFRAVIFLNSAAFAVKLLEVFQPRDAIGDLENDASVDDTRGMLTLSAHPGIHWLEGILEIQLERLEQPTTEECSHLERSAKAGRSLRSHVGSIPPPE